MYIELSFTLISDLDALKRDCNPSLYALNITMMKKLVTLCVTQSVSSIFVGSFILLTSQLQAY